MGAIADWLNQWMRDYVTAGVPASGVNPPDKAEGRSGGAIIEAYIADQIALGLASLTPPAPGGGSYTMPAFSAVGAWVHAGMSADFVMPTVIADDVAILQVIGRGNGGFVRPSGWTQIGTEIDATIASALYWKRCDGTESGDSVHIDATAGSGNINGLISTWRGCVANGDPYEALDTNHGTVSPMSGRSVTTLGPQRLVVDLFSFTTGLDSGLTSDPDVGFTEVFQTAPALGETWAIGDVQQAVSATTIAAPSRTISGASFTAWHVHSFALVPSGAADAVPTSSAAIGGTGGGVGGGTTSGGSGTGVLPHQWTTANNPLTEKMLVSGDDYWVMNGGRTWSVTNPGADDTTLRFEVRPGDVWAQGDAGITPQKNRSELGGVVQYANGSSIHITYDWTVEAGSPNTAAWLNSGQLRQLANDTWSAPFGIYLNGEKMRIAINVAGNNANNWTYFENVFLDTADITRGHAYAMDITATFDMTAGSLLVKRDGVTLVNYSGPLGYSTMGGSVYWKEGVYREVAPETIAITFANLSIT